MRRSGSSPTDQEDVPATVGRRITIAPIVSKAQMARILETYPGFAFIFTQSEFSSHPMTAIERTVGEAVLANESDYKIEFIDVGGNLSRPIKGVKFVLAPTVGGDDELRRRMQSVMLGVSEGKHPDHCTHLLHLCTCLKTRINRNTHLLFIHSLYHMDLKNLIDTMVEHNIAAYSLHHIFLSGENTMYDGECIYSNVAGNVTMQIGRDSQYNDVDPAVLFGPVVTSHGGQYRLSRKVLHTFKYTEIVYFAATRVNNVEPLPTRIDMSLFNRDVTGELGDLEFKIGSANPDLKAFTPQMVFVDMGAHKYRVTGGTLYLENKNTVAQIPRALFHEAHAHIVGKPRVPSEYNLLLQFVKRQAGKYRIPLDLLANSAIAVASIAYFHDIDVEINQMAYLASHASEYAVFNSLLKFTMPVSPPRSHLYVTLPVIVLTAWWRGCGLNPWTYVRQENRYVLAAYALFYFLRRQRQQEMVWHAHEPYTLRARWNVTPKTFWGILHFVFETIRGQPGIRLDVFEAIRQLRGLPTLLREWIHFHRHAIPSAIRHTLQTWKQSLVPSVWLQQLRETLASWRPNFPTDIVSNWREWLFWKTQQWAAMLSRFRLFRSASIWDLLFVRSAQHVAFLTHTQQQISEMTPTALNYIVLRTMGRAFFEEVFKRVTPWWIVPLFEMLADQSDNLLSRMTTGFVMHYIFRRCSLVTGGLLHTVYNLLMLVQMKSKNSTNDVLHLVYRRYRYFQLATRTTERILYGHINLPTTNTKVTHYEPMVGENYASTWPMQPEPDKFIVKYIEHPPRTETELDEVKLEYVKHVGIASSHVLPVVFTDDVSNQLQSLIFRQLRPLKRIHYDVWRDQRWYLKQLPKAVEPFGFDEWNQRFPSGQQALQMMAATSPTMNFKAICERSSMMVKVETAFGSIGVDGNKFASKPPRCIIAHNEHYNATMGPHFWTYNKVLSTEWHSGHDLFYASATTPSIIGEWFQRHHERGATFVECDAKFYDSSFTDEHRQLEAQILFSDNYLRKCYLAAGRKRGYTKKHVYYEFRQRRASGAPETSAMNSLFTGIVVMTLRRVYDVVTHAILCGDNSCFAIYGSTEHILEKIMDCYDRWAFTAKPRICTGMYDVEFCSCAIWPTDLGMRAGVKPGRFYAKIAWSCKQENTHCLRQYLVGSLKSQHHYAYHVPMAYELILCYRRLLVGVEAKFEDKYERFSMEIDENAPPTLEAYSLFCERYDVTMDIIQDFQSLLDEITHLPLIINHELIDAVVAVDL